MGRHEYIVYEYTSLYKENINIQIYVLYTIQVYVYMIQIWYVCMYIYLCVLQSCKGSIENKAEEEQLLKKLLHRQRVNAWKQYITHTNTHAQRFTTDLLKRIRTNGCIIQKDTTFNQKLRAERSYVCLLAALLVFMQHFFAVLL